MKWETIAGAKAETTYNPSKDENLRKVGCLYPDEFPTDPIGGDWDTFKVEKYTQTGVKRIGIRTRILI